MTTLDDATLINEFIKGKNSLLANQNLRVEAAFNSVQLLTKREGLVAKIQVIDQIPTALVRRESGYWNLLYQHLVENTFMPAGKAEQSGFEQFHKSTIPPGYKMNCTQALVLWREWWTRTRNRDAKAVLQMELLVYARNTWYPIRDIVSGQGSLLIKTLVAEIFLSSDDNIVWLSKIANPQAAQPAGTTVGGATVNSPSNPSSPASVPSPETADRFTRVGPQLRRTMGSPFAQSTAAIPLDRRTDSASSESEDGPSSGFLRPDLRQVLRVQNGRLHIKTELGVLIVEGTNLNFWLNEGAKSQASL